MATSTGNKDDDAGPVGDPYSKIATGGFSLWASAVVVLGLSAGLISKTPPAFSSITKPVSPTNAKPLARFFVILIFTTMMWEAAFPLMFVMRSNRDTSKVITFDKRVLLSVGTGAAIALQDITLSCACLGVSAE
ncbi:hypothetical protein CNMCM6936_009545 [Aspergillus lentulus]|uniref:Uncharacterized protein n=1 Tax=Aspergillus lentulus TaxID=293939 RepID=A0AAN5YKH5_ASPLE|nr:hypothetical protein CNMCM6069_000293 [Aspergillus lentulus]KAF4164109.1 hypothetical protein CNMCM6936_009545 [Aspergillus lentulus]KAF4171350.1 hypothetical protein CNMCM8060_003100 [Aspergillus lentulus]KAF4181198.1 hypothetical protein CNMCM7927_000764 [Aspergillus lentulus]KAF4192585.1 hypothetical protein CNMCM8694_000196 [Aspergillus lentulus]